MASEAKETLAVEKLEVVADAGYYNNAEVSLCVEKGITPYIPKADTSANTARGLYAKKDFQLRRGEGCLRVARPERS